MNIEKRTISKNGTVTINHRIYKHKNCPPEMIGRRVMFEIYHHHKFVNLAGLLGYGKDRWDYSHDDDGGVTLWSSEDRESPSS